MDNLINYMDFIKDAFYVHTRNSLLSYFAWMALNECFFHLIFFTFWYFFCVWLWRSCLGPTWPDLKYPMVPRNPPFTTKFERLSSGSTRFFGAWIQALPLNVNVIKIEILKMWIMSKMWSWKCEFYQNWTFENVNFIKIELLTVIFATIEIFKLWFLDKMWIFTPVCSSSSRLRWNVICHMRISSSSSHYFAQQNWVKITAGWEA